MLEKLTIQSLKGAGASFKAQFNPASYRHVYRNHYQGRQGINTTGSSLKYLQSSPEELTFTMVLESDDEYGFLPFAVAASVGVYEKVQDFLKLVYHMDNATHAPKLLKLSWGEMVFEGGLVAADIQYTAFKETGAAVRAEIDVIFRGTVKDPMGSQAKNSPDLTHAVTVKGWQTLPSMTEDIYGDAHLYLLIAEANGLDHFRALQPGGKLHFPPTEKDQSSQAKETAE